MQILLDTHALLWWLLGDDKFSETSRTAMADRDNDVFVSAASAWEISIKYKSGKLPTAARLVADLSGAIAAQGFGELAITVSHANRVGNLPLLHKDPFDRVLIAQALQENMILVSNEAIFERYGVIRLW